ncbi:MAG: acyltransferase family protein [Oscillospiraceae bacterium]|nr:acyltransferase family protein [Oscillospiraceae bacterium]
MKSKKAVMGFAALLIFLFHFYIPFTDSPVETFICRSAYIGVDLFFFLSAVSLGKNEALSFRGFIPNRLKYVYAPFAVFALTAAIYKGWSAKKLLLVLTGIDFLQKGGGAFLWFLPGIMLLYLISPLLVRAKTRFGFKFLIAAPVMCFALEALLQYGFGYTKPLILLNRFPIFMLGLYYFSFPRPKSQGLRLFLILAFLISGGAAVWFFGTVSRLNVPLRDFYYIIAIPYTLAFACLFEYAYERQPRVFAALEFLGGVSLELYGLQMVFGYDIESALVNSTDIGWVAFLLTAVILIPLSHILCKIKKYIINNTKRRQKT